MAVRDQARVLYRLPEQRRFGASGLPGMLTLVLLAVILFLPSGLWSLFARRRTRRLA